MQFDTNIIWVGKGFQSLSTMHASEDVPAAVPWEMLVVASYTSIPLVLCQLNPEESEVSHKSGADTTGSADGIGRK